jgi:hypothetical protein
MITNQAPLELSESELTEIKNLTALGGFANEREFLIAALALYRWAGDQVLNGRSITSISDYDGKVRKFDKPWLEGFVIARDRIQARMPSREKLLEEIRGPKVPAEQVLAEMRKVLAQMEEIDEGRSVAERADEAVAGNV